MKPIFTIRSGVLPADTRVVSFRGSEGLSRPYQFAIHILIPSDDEFDSETAIGGRGTLLVHRDGDAAPFIFNGIFAGIDRVGEYATRGLYSATLVPLLWRQLLTHHSRVFVDDTIPDVIDQILQDGGLSPGSDYELRLEAAYKPQDHVCQYQESNLAFISRLMEREGMYYFFEQGDAQEKLIITDSKGVHAPLDGKPVRYFPQPGDDVSAGEHLRSFVCRHATLPASVNLKDYDYIKPSLDVSGSAQVSPIGQGEINVYGANFLTPSEGKRLAELRAQEYRAREKQYFGVGSVFHLRPGYTFTLEEHPKASFNTDYLCTELTHHGNLSQSEPAIQKLLDIEYVDVYRVEVVAIRAAVQYRAPRATREPRINGIEIAVIDGPAGGPYAEIDNHGRYNVKVNFDEGDLRDGKASTRVRMLQPHGGSTEGFHFPLRKGTEVLLVFLGGDPDRPVIAGVAPNTHKPSAVTSGNHTLNVIQTGSRNRVEMDDQIGLEYIELSTPPEKSFLWLGKPRENNNFYLSTDGNGKIRTGRSLNIWVGEHRTDFVKENMKVDVEGTHTTTVHKDVSETYKMKQTKQVTGDVKETYEATQTTTVSKGLTETVLAGFYNQTITGVHTVTITGNSTQAITGEVSDTVTGNLYHHVTQKLTQDIDNGMVQTIKAGNLKQDITSNYTLDVHGDWTQTIDGKLDQTVKSDIKGTFLGVEFSLKLGSFTSETIVGLKNENMVGGKIEFLGPFKMETVLGFKADIHLGPHFEANSVAEIKAGVVELKSKAIKLGQVMGPKLEQFALDLAMAGLHLRL